MTLHCGSGISFSSGDQISLFRQVGFSVTLQLDASQAQMEDAIRAFGRELMVGGVGLFYFAGHGVQVEVMSRSRLSI